MIFFDDKKADLYEKFLIKINKITPKCTFLKFIYEYVCIKRYLKYSHPNIKISIQKTVYNDNTLQAYDNRLETYVNSNEETSISFVITRKVGYHPGSNPTSGYAVFYNYEDNYLEIKKSITEI